MFFRPKTTITLLLVYLASFPIFGQELFRWHPDPTDREERELGHKVKSVVITGYSRDPNQNYTTPITRTNSYKMSATWSFNRNGNYLKKIDNLSSGVYTYNSKGQLVSSVFTSTKQAYRGNNKMEWKGDTCYVYRIVDGVKKLNHISLSRNGLPVFSDSYYNGKIISHSTYTYTNRGNCTEQRTTYPSGKVGHLEKWEYDQNDSLMEFRRYTQNDTLNYRAFTISRDTLNRISKVHIYETNGTEFGYQNYYYGIKGNLDSIVDMTRMGKLNSISFYNSSGKISSLRNFNSEGKATIEYYYFYDKNQRLIEETEKISGNILRREVITRDSHGEMIKRLVYKNGILSMITDRVLTYYD